MKKKKFLIAALCICAFLLTGCGKDVPAIAVSQADGQQTILEDAPEFIQQYYKQYSAFTSDYGLQYKLGMAYKSFNGYSISVTGQNSYTNQSTLYFEEVAENRENRSFYITFNSGAVADIKDFIAATFMVLDPQIPFSDAVLKAQNLANTASDKDYSQIVSCGGFLLFITPYSGGGASLAFHAVYQKTMWKEVDKEEYLDSDYSIYRAPVMNLNEKMQVNGKVVRWERESAENSYPYAYITVKAGDGKEYTARYPFNINPQVFTEGTQCCIFGFIGQKQDGGPCLVAERIENING